MTETSPEHDEVDRLIEGWKQQRPDVDTSPMQIFSRISRLNRFLSLKRRQAFAKHQLDEWEFDMLSTLRRGGDDAALSPGTMMAELLVSSGTMTNRIDRLEQKGLVKRQPDPSDRRGVLVILTSKGKKAVDNAIQSLVDCEKAMLEDFSPKDCDTMASLLHTLLVPLEQNQVKQK